MRCEKQRENLLVPGDARGLFSVFIDRKLSDTSLQLSGPVCFGKDEACMYCLGVVSTSKMSSLKIFSHAAERTKDSCSLVYLRKPVPE